MSSSIRLTGVIAVFGWGNHACAEGKTRAARTSLTYRDSGLYCNLSFTHGPDTKDEGTTNMLSAGRAASQDVKTLERRPASRTWRSQRPLRRASGSSAQPHDMSLEASASGHSVALPIRLSSSARVP